MNREEEATMRRALRILATIAGSVVGAVVGSALLFFAALASVSSVTKDMWESGARLWGIVIFGALGLFSEPSWERQEEQPSRRRP